MNVIICLHRRCKDTESLLSLGDQMASTFLSGESLEQFSQELPRCLPSAVSTESCTVPVGLSNDTYTARMHTVRHHQRETPLCPTYTCIPEVSPRNVHFPWLWRRKW